MSFYSRPIILLTLFDSIRHIFGFPCNEVIKIYYLYVAFIIIIVWYILKDPKRDLFFISILCSMVYFLPCFFGYVSISYRGSRIYEKIDYRLYFIHIIFMTLLIIFRNLKYKLPTVKLTANKVIFDNKLLIFTLYVTWLVLFVGLLLLLKENLLVDKTKLPRGFYSYYFTIYNLLLVYSVVANYKSQRHRYIITQIPAILLTIIQGHRSYLVFILLAIIINEFINNKRNLFKFKYIVVIVFTGIFGFLGKSIVATMRLGLSLRDSIIYIFNLENVTRNITHSEPFLTQYILNKTITTDFTLGFGYISRYILKAFFISPNKTTNIKSFYDAFVDNFFPDINYGIAYNIFSEPYAIAGLYGVIIFTIIYAVAINILDMLLRSEDDIISSLALSMSSIYSFYIFRNSIENILLWSQILMIIFFFCFTLQIMKYKMKIRYIRYNSKSRDSVS